jgi:hypothetical protein
MYRSFFGSFSSEKEPLPLLALDLNVLPGASGMSAALLAKASGFGVL